MKPLTGIRVVNLAVNIPGPAAAMRLSQFGADVIKIEPPSGDPLRVACRPYYDHFTAGHEIITLDLKSLEGRRQLEAHLASADLVFTANRQAALARLGLEWKTLHARFPRLCLVAVTGFRAPHDNLPGHDLTFQAANGLLDPPRMPRTLVADIGAAEQAVSAALALLLARERTGEADHAEVAISDAAEWFGLPARLGLTVGGPLSGALASYGIYHAQDGYVALAALEGHFLDRLREMLGTHEVSRENLERLFATRTVSEWEACAREQDIPLAAVRY